jgi:HEAT repeat protein
MRVENWRKLCVFLIFCFSWGLAAAGAQEPEFRRTVEALLSSKDINSSRLKAVENLERLQNRKGVTYLVKVLKDNEFPYPFAAIHALAYLGGPEASGYLENYWKELEKSEKEVSIEEDRDYIKSKKAFVAAALYHLGVKKHVEYAYDLAKSTDKGLRTNGAAALGMVDSKTSQELLLNILKNDEMVLPRNFAAMSLAELKYPGVLDVVAELVKNGELPHEILEEVREKLKKKE